MIIKEKHGADAYNNAKSGPCIALVLTILTLISCRSDKDAPDVSHLDGTFQLTRTEQTLFALDTLAPEERVKPLFDQHENFWNLYFTVIVPQVDSSGQTPDSSDFRHWRPLVRDPYMRAIAESVAAEYSDMTDIQAQLSEAFQYLQYYFPGNRVPNVYTLISGFGYFPFIFEDGERDGLGISLEMFLGSDFPYRTFTGNVNAFSDYLTRTYNRDHLAKRTIEVLVDDLVGPPPGDRLIDIMMNNGIKLYIIEHLIPALPDTALFEYTPDQLAWCTSNEKNLWAHLLKDDLLYASEVGKIQKLINPAPAVPGMPPEAPGGVANWTGWKIIHALIERDPDIKMVDLLSVQEAQAIVEQARYRPK